MGRRFNRWQAALVRTILLRVALTAALSLPGMAMANFERGREVAATHCTRCHVVGDINPYGGIESTPSFIGMKRLADWERRYAEFYILPPHPALVRIVEDCRVAAIDATTAQRGVRSKRDCRTYKPQSCLPGRRSVP